jgi:pimeloyl-ACP methyl ester carboxylesterase
LILAAAPRRVVTQDGVALALHHLGAKGAPPLLWGHANGFCTGSYTALLRELASDHDVWAWDMRGHGASPLPAGAELRDAMALLQVAGDATLACTAVRDATGQQPHVAGHSFGALALLLAAQGGAPWRSGCFFEPPAPTRAMVQDPAHIASNQARLAATLRRRRQWPSPGAFAARLRQDPGHAGISDAGLIAHAEAALRREGAQWVLRCAPETEAAVYGITFSSLAQDTLRSTGRPVLFVASAAAPDRWLAAAQAEAAARCAGRLLRLPGTTHLLPLEQPSACAAAIRSLTQHATAEAP